MNSMNTSNIEVSEVQEVVRDYKEKAKFDKITAENLPKWKKQSQTSKENVL